VYDSLKTTFDFEAKLFFELTEFIFVNGFFIFYFSEARLDCLVL